MEMWIREIDLLLCQFVDTSISEFQNFLLSFFKFNEIFIGLWKSRLAVNFLLLLKSINTY